MYLVLVIQCTAGWRSHLGRLPAWWKGYWNLRPLSWYSLRWNCPGLWTCHLPTSSNMVDHSQQARNSYRKCTYVFRCTIINPHLRLRFYFNAVFLRLVVKNTPRRLMRKNDICIVFQLQALENRPWWVLRQLFRWWPTAGNNNMATKQEVLVYGKVW